VTELHVTAEAEIRPTEDRSKIETAFTNLFSGGIEVEGELDDYGKMILRGEGRESLEKFRIILLRDQIRNAAKSVLWRGTQDQQIIVFLNKQAAYAGHVSFSSPVGESPMGPIKLTIETTNPADVVHWLTGVGEDSRKK
jgi:uncharacterized protein